METKWLNVLVLTVFLCVSLEITHGSNTTTETAKSTGRQARTVTATPIHDFTSQDLSGSLSSNDTVSTVAAHVSTEISANPGTDTSAETKKATNNPIGITPSKENGFSSKGSTPKTNGSTSKVSKNEVSSTQKPSSENPLANLANMVKLLGNFLPKKSVDLISAMTQNQSAWTVTNALNVLLPLGKMAGVRALSQGGVSDACSRDMGLIIDGILGREEWALKMLDASLKIPANLYDTVLSGTPKALGDYDECLAVHGEATGHEINAKYCRAAFKMPLPPGTMPLTPNTGTAYLGLCVSKSCSSSDVGLIISNRTAEQVCLAFSLYSNGVKLMGTSQGAGSLGAVNGVRFLSMGWVILGHTYFFTADYDENLGAYFSKHVKDWTFSAIPYAGVSVDTFFALSGILVAYLTLRELKKLGGASKLNWFMFYFHRFWRLTPPYMLVMMVGVVVLPYVVQGPMSSNDDLPFMAGCRTAWWANLLYVNNYFESQSCMAWGWYLANDMQFYIISPLILLPFFYNAIAGAVVSGAFLVATVTAVGVVTRNHEYPSQMFSPFVNPPKDGNYYKNLYVPSYARMGPYIVGLVTGYLLYRCKSKCRMPKLVTVVGWLLCLGSTCAVIYGEYTDGDSHVMSLWESVIFGAVFRTVWGLAVCWVIFACATGHGGWINDILSWKAFVPLGRLTYCAYLVHPLVMMVYYMSRRSPVFFNNYEVIYLFFAQMVMAYGVAFVTSLFFESPMMGLEKVVFKKGKH